MTIYICFIVLSFLFLFLANEFYFHIVCSLQQEQHILRGIKGKYDMIAFGSAYCRHGLAFPKETKGYNFGYVSQFFYYTDKMLRDYAPKCLNKGGVVYLIIADLVFSRVGNSMYGADRYSLILSKDSLGNEFSFNTYLKMRFPLFFHPRDVITKILQYIVKGKEGTNYYKFYMAEENASSYEESITGAKRRCSSWCKQFGLKDTFSADIPNELSENFKLTRTLLAKMIEYCEGMGYRPILVVTPVSEIMNRQIGEAFIQKVLFDNIDASNMKKVPFLNYLRDSRFQDITLYTKDNPDFLNARGRRLFTDVLISDTIELQRKHII